MTLPRREMIESHTDGIGTHVHLTPTTRWNDAEPAKELRAGDRLVLGGLRTFSINSVVSYALECGEDPVAAIDHARGLGHELVWINGLGATLSRAPRAPRAHIIVEIGDRVRFEGQVYTIQPAPNHNLRLVPETAAEAAA